MTPDQSHWVIILASASAVFEIWGTITVLVSYFRSASVAEAIWKAASGSGGFVARQSLAPWADLSELATLAGPLRKKLWITLGLLAYILGAIFGLLAVIVGVS